MLKVRAVARRSMRSHRVTGDATALFEIALRADRRSAFFSWTPWERGPGVTGIESRAG